MGEKTSELEECKYCEGQGKVQVFMAEDDVRIEKCPICKGKGRIAKAKNVDIEMPLWIG